MYVGLKQPRGDGERYVTPARAAAKETRRRGKRETWTPGRNKARANLVQEAEKREPENEVEHMADENYVIFPELFRP